MSKTPIQDDLTSKKTQNTNQKALDNLDNLARDGSTKRVDFENQFATASTNSKKLNGNTVDLSKNKSRFTWGKRTKSLGVHAEDYKEEINLTADSKNQAAEFDSKKLNVNYKVSTENAVTSNKSDKQHETKAPSNRAIKTKLANLTTANPKDLCIRAKINKDIVDLSRFFEHEVLVNFLNNANEVLEFSKNLGSSDLEYYLGISKTPEEFLKHCEKEGITLADSRIADLNTNFEKTKVKIMNDLIGKSEDQQKKFQNIINTNNTIIENTGVHSLYIAYDFLVGSTRTGVGINAPIVLYPIELIFENGSYSVQHLKSGYVVNEKLLTLLKKEYELEWIIADIAKIKDLNKLLDTIREAINSPFAVKSYPNHEFMEQSSVELSKIPYLTTYDSALLGIFEPSGGALKDNLEKLVEMNVDPFVSENEYADNKFINEEVENAPLLEIGRPLNIYQKYAVRSALSQNTLIYGPPGTGKSEVIANIIANAISNNKSVLVVSEKKAALDVLHERLQSIANLALFIYDLDDKAGFYRKISNIGEKVNNMRLDGIEVKNFNLRNKLLSINKWEEVAKSHNDLRKYIWNLVELNKKVDSLGTTFSDYLSYRSHTDTKLLQYAREANVIEYIDSIMNKYFFESIDKLMFKFNEYKDFLLAYGIDEPKISEKLKAQKIELTKFQVEDNLLEYLIESQPKIKDRVKLLTQMLDQFNLGENEEFLNLLRNEPNILKKQQDALLTFNHQFEGLVKSGFLTFLVANYDQLDTFLNKYELARDKSKQQFLNHFLATGKMSKLTSLIGGKKPVENPELKLKAIKEFLKIPHARYQYIPLLLNPNLDYINKNTVHFYLNSWLLNSYIKELGLKQFTFFDDEVLIKLTPVKALNSTTYDEYRRLINFDNEIMNHYVDLMRENVNDIIAKDRELVIDASANASKDIENLYLEYLKYELSQLSPEQKARMQDIFSIANRTLKNTASIKDFVQEYYKELSIIFPIWISLPELVAQIFPLEKGIFDYGIFDEASQMFVERAYPIVYRCKIAIVAGDDKQLKPTSFFSTRVAESRLDYEINDNDQVDSLLDRAQVSLWSSYNLRNHYRSTHRDLIQFSNDYIYNNKLHFATKNGTSGAGIEVINTKGIAEDSVNIGEAEVVLQQLAKNIDKYNKIIVITFGAKQSNYIEQLIFKNSESMPNVYKKFANGLLVITNLENVQGNEGDLVILSITYSKNREGILRNAYGPLIMDGGANRLNVAITRAKDKMIVVKSLFAKDMNINSNNQNAVVFRAFIEYCDKFNSLNKQTTTASTETLVNELFRKEVENTLKRILQKKTNLEIIPNYDIGSKVIDFAIVNKLDQVVQLAIVLNPWKRSFTVQDYLENVDNFYFIKDRGYKVFRIEEYNWTYNQSSVENHLIARIDALNLNKNN